jgi:hypothetical protein
MPGAARASRQSSPTASLIDLDLHLVRDGDAWKIDQESWRFAPGGGP